MRKEIDTEVSFFCPSLPCSVNDEISVCLSQAFRFTDFARIDSAVQFTWLLNQRTAAAKLGQREILLEFSHHTVLTAGGSPFPIGETLNHFYRSEYCLLTLLND